MGMFDFFTQEIAIDLGTANTLVIHNDKVVVDEPSIVAIDRTSMKIIGIGRKAQQMHGKTHENIKTIRPLKDGVIADFQAAEHMIRGFIKMMKPNARFFNPSLRMVICIPSGITEVEKRAVRDSAEHAGGKEVYLIHEPMAAAIGIGIDVEEPMGNMVIDIGGGTSEMFKEVDHDLHRSVGGSRGVGGGGGGRQGGPLEDRDGCRARNPNLEFKSKTDGATGSPHFFAHAGFDFGRKPLEQDGHSRSTIPSGIFSPHNSKTQRQIKQAL